VYFTTQIPHNLYVPASGNVLIAPHVHWTFNAEPTTGRTVIWELNYVLAKYLARFSEAVTALDAETYTTTAAAEIRTHLISPFPMISIPAADLAKRSIMAGDDGTLLFFVNTTDIETPPHKNAGWRIMRPTQRQEGDGDRLKPGQDK
jgi:hypothetical protein